MNTKFSLPNYYFLSLFFLMTIQNSVLAKDENVIRHYADIAEAKYQDALKASQNLGARVEELLKTPSPQTLNAAKKAWIDARVPYLQTEVFRFGNPIVDDWEGKVNAWPLDEGLIDYVDKTYLTGGEDNKLRQANVIANKQLKIDGKIVDAANITATLLEEHLQEAAGIEANVATGYHAVEFLLWGQDLNIDPTQPGSRPYTDFSTTKCTNENCDRRRTYLKVATQLLIDDLKTMVNSWSDKGAARKALIQKPLNEGLGVILKGMGSLSQGELAGERLELGLLLGDQEEEHDCFSDNTHNAHYYSALGVQNVYLGTYKNTSGEILKGPALSDILVKIDRKLDKKLKDGLAFTMQKMQALVNHANNVEHYDQMIRKDNKKGNQIIQAAIDALIQQSKTLEQVTNKIGLTNNEVDSFQ